MSDDDPTWDEGVMGKIDVERAFIGACFTDPEVLADSTLTGDDFESPVYGEIFDRMRARLAEGIGVSQALLAEDFPKRLTEIWGSTDSFAETALGALHEVAIRHRATRRALRVAAIRINAIADGNSTEHMVDRARAEVDAALRGDEAKVSSMLTDAREVLARHREHVALVPSPWPSLNEVIGGFGPGRMYVFGARPGVGKSAVASQIAYALAASGPVIFATMEMDRGEVYSRIVSQQAAVYYGAMSKAPSEFIAAREAAWLATGLRDIRVLDSGTQSVGSIRSAVRTANREQQVAGVIVDYLHLMTGEGENETNRINNITRGLKQMGMDLRVPVIALSQLSRPGQRATNRPRLDDLRGSGGIEQDGDVVIFLYRDEDGEQTTLNTSLNMYVAKNRQGPSFVNIDLDWQGDFVRAVERLPL